MALAFHRTNTNHRLITKYEPVIWQGLISFGLGVIYWRTLLPVVGYWGDMAKFAFIGKVLGTPHLSSYPTYVMLNYLFVTYFPKGTLALKANILSAVFSIIAAWFLFGILNELKIRRLIAFSVVMGFGLTFSMWTSSLVAEVYTLNILFSASVIYFLLRWNRTRNASDFYLASVFYAISFGNHLTMIGLFPAFAWMVWQTDRTIFFSPQKIILMMGVIFLGLIQYSYVAWRTIDPNTVYLETDTNTLLGFVFGFGLTESVGFSVKDWWTIRLPQIATFILSEYSIWLIGVVYGFFQMRNKILNIFLGLSLLGSIFIVMILNPELNAREFGVFLLPAYFVLALYLGIGLEHISKRIFRYPGLVMIWVTIPFFFFMLNYRQADQSQRIQHARIAEKVLATVDRDAVIVVNDYDYACQLWYYLLGEEYEQKNIYALPMNFTSYEGLRSYLTGEGELNLYPQRKIVPSELSVYALWGLSNELSEAGFVVLSTETKHIYRIQTND